MAYRILITFTCFYLLANIVRGESPTTTITTPVQNMSNLLDQVPDVQIDSDGVFKYILINVSLGCDQYFKLIGPYKIIVRGKIYPIYHDDMYEEESYKLRKLGLHSQCLGGGRIKHKPGSKKILVYGYSQAFGQADHQCTVDVLKKVYKNYDISFSNDGY